MENDYSSLPNFEVDKVSRYKAYQKEKKTNFYDTVLQVNIGLDHDFYTEIKPSPHKDTEIVLVNKYYTLENYEPKDLKTLSYDNKYKLQKNAAEAFEKLVAFAKQNQIYLIPYSAYRSYEYQASLYNDYVKKDGKEIADTYSARPGHSEHQTGLAVDVWSKGYQKLQEKDALWLKENAHKFGFIIRYTKEQEAITGYIEEPWHLRYLGISMATDVYQKGITYEEYYDLYIK